MNAWKPRRTAIRRCKSVFKDFFLVKYVWKSYVLFQTADSRLPHKTSFFCIKWLKRIWTKLSPLIFFYLAGSISFYQLVTKDLWMKTTILSFRFKINLNGCLKILRGMFGFGFSVIIGLLIRLNKVNGIRNCWSKNQAYLKLFFAYIGSSVSQF